MSRVLISLGCVFLALGAAAWLLEKAGLRLGHLPGDFVAGRGAVRVYAPLGTCILLSLLLTLAMWLIGSAKR
ncbi:MAG TPA: DUF2905 family protein [Armatimonadota bacterium]|jgi:hypothetical protein